MTYLFTKTYMGIRKHLLKEAWTFVERDSIRLFVIGKNGEECVLRNLPLTVGGPNDGYVSPAEFVPLYESYDHTFRDFSFNLYRDAVMTLKYNQKWTGQELILAAIFLPDFEKWAESVSKKG